MLGRAIGIVVATAVLASPVACTVSGNVYSDSEWRQVKRYRSVWEREWEGIRKSSQPLLPSVRSPGVCNKGGTKNGCYRVSLRLATDFEKLAASLEGDWIPAHFQTANATLHQAIELDIRALQMRAAAVANSDDVTWQKSNQLIAEAVRLFQLAYSQFPPDTRPVPPPYV